MNDTLSKVIEDAPITGEIRCNNCGRIRSETEIDEPQPEIGWVTLTAMRGEVVIQKMHICPWCWEEVIANEDAKEDTNVDKA